MCLAVLDVACWRDGIGDAIIAHERVSGVWPALEGGGGAGGLCSGQAQKRTLLLDGNSRT